MIKSKNHRIVVLITIFFSGFLLLPAQNLSIEQSEVWHEVENKWKNWKAGDLNTAFKNIHEECLLWNDVDATPITKEEWVKSMKAMQGSIIEINYNIEPVRILLQSSSAVVHYNYRYTFAFSVGEGVQKVSDHGKWSEFFTKEHGQWKLLGEFTFHIEASTAKYAPKIETFVFSSDNINQTGKIYFPPSYASNKDLPVIYLIDFTEQHYKISTDEFEKVIDAVKQLEIDALVVSLANIPDIDAEPESYHDNYDIYKNMAFYVDENYSSNSSRTFIGKGSEASVVLMTLFLEDKETSLFENFIATDPSPSYADTLFNVIESNDFPQDKSNKKLHFSFTTSNDRDKCTKLINLINEAQYPWLQFQSKEYTDSTYENTYPIAFTEGLQYVFKN